MQVISDHPDHIRREVTVWRKESSGAEEELPSWTGRGIQFEAPSRMTKQHATAGQNLPAHLNKFIVLASCPRRQCCSTVVLNLGYNTSSCTAVGG